MVEIVDSDDMLTDGATVECDEGGGAMVLAATQTREATPAQKLAVQEGLSQPPQKMCACVNTREFSCSSNTSMGISNRGKTSTGQQQTCQWCGQNC
jgi:hypothetical protein